jgi:hypothetical protein
MSRALLAFNPEAHGSDSNILLFGVAMPRPTHGVGISALEEIDLASHFLEAGSIASLNTLLQHIIQRSSATHGTALPPRAAAPLLLSLMRVAKLVHDALRSEGTGQFALSPEAIFGTELEGLSPEDQEFETARQFVQFADELTRAALRASHGLRPDAFDAENPALRRLAPGVPRALGQAGFNTRGGMRFGQ